MKKIKISDSEKRLLFILLSVVMIAASYFFFFQKNQAKAAELEETNLADAQTVLRLEGMVGMQAQVEQDIADNKQLIEDIIAKYPPNMTTEKAIVFTQEMEEATNVKITAINFLMDNLVMNISGGAAETGAPAADAAASADSTDLLAAADAAADNTAAAPADGTAAAQQAADTQKIGYYAALSMNYSASYEEFKDMLDYINSQKDRTTAPAVTANYDEATGGLTGLVTVHMYYLTNTGREYEKPVVHGVNKGVTDVFRSSGIGSGGAAAGASDENGGDGNEGEDANGQEGNGEDQEP